MQKEKKAPFSGKFQPLVNKGDCVQNRQVIGTILFGNIYKQLSNAAGEVIKILGVTQVNADDVICTVEDASAKCMAIINAPFTAAVAGRAKPKAAKKKKAVKKAKPTTKKKSAAKKAKPKTAKKAAVKKSAKKASKKPVKKARKNKR